MEVPEQGPVGLSEQMVKIEHDLLQVCIIIYMCGECLCVYFTSTHAYVCGFEIVLVIACLRFCVPVFDYVFARGDFFLSKSRLLTRYSICVFCMWLAVAR